MTPEREFPDNPDEELLFAEEEATPAVEATPWKVLIVDDEPAVHQVTELALRDLRYEDRPLCFLHAYSREQAQQLLPDHKDLAVVLLDVVMEEDDSGLQLVRYIREELENHMVRIILRTGQPGQAPEFDVILAFDINDYKTKEDLTSVKLFTAMIVALRSYCDLLRIEHGKNHLEHLVDGYSRFVPHEFLSFLDKHCITEVELGDQIETEMTVLFSDIRDFTFLSEVMTPQQNFNFINSYLSRMEPIIRRHNGFIDKYIGDAIMALFPREPDDGLRAALEMLSILADYNAGRDRAGYQPIRIGVGLHTGRLMLGIVGGPRRMDGTVISDAVNLASRIEGLNKSFGSYLLLSDECFHGLRHGENYTFRPLDQVFVKGKQQAIDIYEVLDGEPQPGRGLKQQTLALFEQGVTHFHQGRREPAAKCFREVLVRHPDDRAAAIYLDRVLRREDAD